MKHKTVKAAHFEELPMVDTPSGPATEPGSHTDEPVEHAPIDQHAPG